MSDLTRYDVRKNQGALDRLEREADKLRALDRRAADDPTAWLEETLKIERAE